MKLFTDGRIDSRDKDKPIEGWRYRRSVSHRPAYFVLVYDKDDLKFN
jgi:hypothetical protein